MKTLFALKIAVVTLLFALAATAAACGGDDDGDSSGTDKTPATDGSGGIDAGEGAGKMEVTSTAFQDGETIPEEYSCDGDDVPPPVSWTGVPDDARSLVLVMDDPDADGFVHWLVYDIPVKVTGFAETPDSEKLPSGAKQAVNSFGDVGYGGPCPPGDEEHTYRIRVLALDSELGLDPGAESGEVNDALADAEVLDSGKLEGTFAK